MAENNLQFKAILWNKLLLKTINIKKLQNNKQRLTVLLDYSYLTLVVTEPAPLLFFVQVSYAGVLLPKRVS